MTIPLNCLFRARTPEKKEGNQRQVLGFKYAHTDPEATLLEMARRLIALGGVEKRHPVWKWKWNKRHVVIGAMLLLTPLAALTARACRRRWGRKKRKAE